MKSPASSPAARLAPLAALAALALLRAAAAQSVRDTFDCAMRDFALEFAAL